MCYWRAKTRIFKAGTLAMTEHLTEQMMENYRTRRMPVTELPAASDHLAGCAECRQRLGQSQAVDTLVNYFQTNFAVDAAEDVHLSYEQITDYLDGKLAVAERQAVDAHLQSCPLCLDEMQELRAFDTQMAAYPEKVYAPSAPAPLSQRVLAWAGFERFQNLTRAIAAIFSWRIVGALAVILLAVAVTLLWRAGREREESPNIAQGPNPTMPSPVVSPAPVTDTVPSPPIDQPIETNPLLAGVTSPPPAVEAALNSGRVRIPAAVKDLIGERGRLMGGSGGKETFKPLAPVGMVIRENQPTLSWMPLEGATGYRVYVFTPEYDEVDRSDLITDTKWTLGKSLDRGKTYIWQIKADKDGQVVTAPTRPDPEARFRVLEQTKLNELARAEKSYSGNHLALGVLYAEAGLIADAERELRALQAAHPNDATARKLLLSLQTQRNAKPSAK